MAINRGTIRLLYRLSYNSLQLPSSRRAYRGNPQFWIKSNRQLISGALLTVVGAWVKYAGARATSSPFAIVVVGQLISGAGQPFFLNVPTHYSDKWFSATSRVSATALMSLSNAVGAAVGQLVNPFMAPNADDIPNMVGHRFLN